MPVFPGRGFLMFERLKSWFGAPMSEASVQEQMDQLRHRTPAPVLWLLGRTQSGKTSLVKFLTGAEEAEIGNGFRPCTRFSRLYEFPTTETPLMTFLDTRGMDEAGYEPAQDLTEFSGKAQAVLVTVKLLDHAQERVVQHLRRIRAERADRPMILVLTCLHEAYPQRQHPQEYPFRVERGQTTLAEAGLPEGVALSLEEQQRRFAGLVDFVVPVDLTRPEEGFAEPNFGGAKLKEVLLESLPAAYRQTLLSLTEATRELQDLYARIALPHIIGYSSMAASAGAVPIPGLDLMILPAIQTRMIAHLARLYGQPLTATRFLELSSALGMGLMLRHAVRQLAKFVPVVGSMVGSALAGASTFALGKAFCYYYRAVHQGHVPKPEDLRHYYEEQLAEAQRLWAGTGIRQAKQE